MQKQLKDFIKSFKADKIFLNIILYDLIFYLIATVSFVLGGYALRTQVGKVDTSMLNQYILQRSPEEIQVLNSQMKAFFAVFILTILGVLIALLAAWSLSRGLMFTSILKKKFNKNYFLKFAGLNLIIGAAAVAVILLFSRFIEIPSVFYIFYAVVLILVYFIAMIYTYFTKKNNQIFNSIGKGLTIGIKKLKHMFIPLLLILAVFVILSFLNYGIQRYYQIKYLSIILLIIYSAWARPYFVSEAEKVMS